MKRVVAALNPKLDGFEASCFDGVYIAGEASADEVAAMAAGRKRRRRRRTTALPTAVPSRCRAQPSWPDGRPQDPAQAAPAGLGRDTLAVREGLPASAWSENSEALFLTSSFVQPDAATAAARFANEEEAFIYSRFTNPTVMMMERRLAALEGAEACIATSSGMSAILLLGMGLLKAGDHVVCSQSVFGSTVMLFGREFAKFGVETTFVSQTDVGEWRAAIRPNTKLLFAESPTNPLTEVCDIRALAEIAHAAGAGLAVDNCFCTPALQRPVEYGADYVIHSGTKYLDGQGRVIAGALCASESVVNDKFVPVMRSAGWRCRRSTPGSSSRASRRSRSAWKRRARGR
jgi:O-succinylhomoserine sulfhydrylase